MTVKNGKYSCKIGVKKQLPRCVFLFRLASLLFEDTKECHLNSTNYFERMLYQIQRRV